MPNDDDRPIRVRGGSRRSPRGGDRGGGRRRPCGRDATVELDVRAEEANVRPLGEDGTMVCEGDRTVWRTSAALRLRGVLDGRKI